MQFMGTAPAKRNYLAEALKGGVESYTGAREKRVENEVKLAEISYDKKSKAASLIMKQTENATPQQKKAIGESQAGELITDVYGKEVFDAWMGVGSSGQASKLAEVNTWITLKGQPSRFDKAGIRLGKAEMDREIAFKLRDPDWKTTYPGAASNFASSYPSVQQSDDKGSAWFWGKKKTKKLNYGGMNENELHKRAKEGDPKAIQEAIRKGYMSGGN